VIVPKEYLIPLLNSMVRSGHKEIQLFEGYRNIGPILSCGMEGLTFPLDIISQSSYESELVDSIESLSYRELITLVVKGSGIFPPHEIDPIRNYFMELTKGRNLVRGDRPVWLFYDTCAIMNNLPYVFRKNIKVEMATTTSMGVQNEIEEKMDMRFKSIDVLDRYAEVYPNGTEDFFLQPLKVGRIARLCYPEIDLMRKDLGRNIIEDGEKGDTAILNAFQREARMMNVDGVVVSCDRIMIERAESHGMKGLYVAPTVRLPRDVRVKMSDVAMMIFRASVLYGKVRINEDLVVRGVWKGKENTDWKQEKVWVESKFEKDLAELKRLMEKLG
jgi:hypothetical protein